MTTLELARQVAMAGRRHRSLERAAVEVLRTLDHHKTWFCKQRQVNGITVDTPMPRPHVVLGEAVAPAGGAEQIAAEVRAVKRHLNRK